MPERDLASCFLEGLLGASGVPDAQLAAGCSGTDAALQSTLQSLANPGRDQERWRPPEGPGERAQIRKALIMLLRPVLHAFRDKARRRGPRRSGIEREAHRVLSSVRGQPGPGPGCGAGDEDEDVDVNKDLDVDRAERAHEDESGPGSDPEPGRVHRRERGRPCADDEGFD